MFQTATNSDSAQKVLQTKGVGHYWDQLIQFLSSGGAEKNDDFVRLNLVGDDDSEEEEEEDGDATKDMVTT